MKNLILFTLLFNYYIVNAQTYTEKYNELYSRYEYFNESGKLVAYKYYDSLYKVWKYQTLQTEETKSTYIDPINTTLVNTALATNQNRYDANINRMYSAIADIKNKINNLTFSEEVRQNILRGFNSKCLSTIDSKKLDYSSNSITSQAVNYLYDCVNNIITSQPKEEPKEERKVKDEVLAFMQYYGGYNIPIIEEYTMQNYKWIKTKTDTGKNLFYYDGDIIWFKRGNNNWTFRPLTYRSFTPSIKMYTYTSPYGDVFISEDFRVVILFDEEYGKVVKKYEFPIGDYSKEILPN